MGHVDFAMVDEAKQTLEFQEACVSQHDHRVLVRRYVLEQVPEVGTASTEQHSVSSKTPALSSKGDVHQLFPVQQRFERVDNVRLEVVPSQAELLLSLMLWII